MQYIILALCLGLVIGRFMRGHTALRFVSQVTMAGVAGLLFVMGAQIGSDSAVIAVLPTLGGKAVVFAACSIIGGVLFSLPLRSRRVP